MLPGHTTYFVNAIPLKRLGKTRVAGILAAGQHLSSEIS